jgi:uncharacterized protein YfaS (alpha-2-macroglobulin family)
MLGIESRYNSYGSRIDSKIDAARSTGITRVDSIQIPITKRDSEGIFVQRIDIHRLPPGLYAVSTTANDISQVDWIMVTSLGLVTKNADGKLLAYTVDLKSGKPVGDADVRVYNGSSISASAKTGPDGLADISLPGGDGQSQTIVARKADSFAYLSSWLSSRNGSDKIIYTYTERPVYRPGQRVYFKGIVRELKDDKYNVVAKQPLTVEVRDDRDTLIYRSKLTTDRFGCYSGDFKLNDETTSGSYGITTSINGERIGDGAGFQVASYQKPEFSVKVNFAKKQIGRAHV